MSIKNIYTFIILIFLFVSPCFATNYYVKDGGTSSACTTWTDACDQLSTAENLAARGDTVYVADGTYTGATFNTPTSGTTPITIKKSTVADHGTETGYVEADHNGTATFTSTLNFATPYWIIDGVTGGGPGSWSTGHGFIIAFDSATPTYPSVYLSSGASNVILSHIFYNNTYNAAHCSTAISSAGRTAPNVQVRYSYFAGYLGSVVAITSETSDGWIFEYNYFAENKSSVTNPWCHGNIITCRGTDDLTIRYNIFEDAVGTGYITAMNGGTAADDSDIVLAENWYIHGNVFRGTKEVASAINVVYLNHTSVQKQVAKNWYVYNNDFVGLRNNSTFNDTKMIYIENDAGGIVFKNNIVYDCESPNLYDTNGTITHDYNWWTGAAPTGHGANCIENQAGNPFTNSAGGDYTLVAALTGDSSIGATYNKDWTTATRGGDAVWDMGALEYVDGGAPPDTDTPDISTIVIDATGTILTVTLDEDVTVNNGTGFTLSCASASGEGLAYVSESNGVLTFNITGVAIDDDDTCTLDYATTNGIVDAASNALETIGDPVAVDNQSTNTPEATSYTVSVSVGEGCSLSPARHQTIETGATASITCTPSVNYQCITWTGTCSGSGTTSWSATITGDCTATQPCQKIASDATIGSGCAITVGSGPAIRVY